MTEPGFIAATISSVQSSGASRFGNERGGDDDINLGRQFTELGKLRVRGTQGTETEA